jgi:ribosomal protein S18 acetylase RimI-like enzyme
MSSAAPVVRRLGPDDVDAVVDLAMLCDIAEAGEPDPEVVDWIRGSTSAGDMCLFGVDDDAGLAAFGFLDREHGRAGLEADVRVRPGLPLDLGLPILDAVRAAGRDFDATKPLHIFANAAATAQRRWLEARGAREIRHFWRMQIDFDDGPPPAPSALPGVTVRQVRDESEWPLVHRIVDTAFSEHFGHTGERTYDDFLRMWQQRHGFDPTLWWVAEVDGAPAAACLAITVGDGGHIGTLGTLRPARGRGVGTVLLRTAFGEFHRRGYRKVTLGVDAENVTNAVRLYESVGMRSVLDYPLYELPPLAPPSPPSPR